MAKGAKKTGMGGMGASKPAAKKVNLKKDVSARLVPGVGIGLAEIIAIGALSILLFVAAPYLARLLGHYSYAGASALALLSSASIFVPTAPLIFAIIGMSRGLDPLTLALVCGVGSGLGEISAYFFGRGSLHLLEAQNKQFGWLIKLQKGILRKHAGLGIFILAAVPNPLFDVAGITAGLMKMKWWKFLLWCTAGRILHFLIIAYFGLWVHRFF